MNAADITAPEQLPEGPARDIFTSRKRLRDIFYVALTKRVSPEAMLVNAIGRVIAHTAPHVVLPPVIGTAASLNMAIINAAATGNGKTTLADTVAAHVKVKVRNGGFISNQVLVDPDSSVVECGAATTGEGIASMFDQRAYLAYKAALEATNGEDSGRIPAAVPRPPDRAIFTEDEGKALQALASRAGATIVPTLTKAVTGSSLSTNGSSTESKRDVPSRCFRMLYVANIQPIHTGWILEDAGSGFPQRFVWSDASTRYGARKEYDRTTLSSTKYHAYGDSTGNAEVIDVILPFETVERRELPSGASGWNDPEAASSQIPIEFPETVTAKLEYDFDNAGNATSLSSHRNLTQLKMAAGLALMEEPTLVDSPHGGKEIRATEEDWELAGLIMDLSDAVMQHCSAECEGTKQQKATAEEKLRSKAREEAEAAREAEMREMVLDLAAEGGQLKGRGGLRDKCRRYRRELDSMVEDMVEAGEVLRVGNCLQLCPEPGSEEDDTTEGSVFDLAALHNFARQRPSDPIHTLEQPPSETGRDGPPLQGTGTETGGTS